MSVTIEQVQPAELTTNNGSWTEYGRQSVASDSNLTLDIEVTARTDDATNDCALWRYTALARREEDDPVEMVSSLLAIVAPQKTLGASLWDFRVTIDDDAFVFEVKGASSKTINWWAKIHVRQYTES